MKKLWFKRKLFGWGWYPASWEGWVVTAVFVALIVAFSLTVDENASAQDMAFTFLLPVLILTATFIRIAYKTGEAPRWQWGKDKKD